MKALSLVALALFGLSSTALAGSDARSDTASSVDEVEQVADGVLSRRPTVHRTSTAKRPAARPAPHHSTAVRPAPHPASHPAVRPAPRPAVRPAARPAVRPAARPAVHHPAPPPPVRVVHARPAHPHPSYHTTRVVHYGQPRHVVVYHRPIRYYHGVFVYGPRPIYHYRYVSAQPRVREAHLPKRRLDRAESLAVGLRTGALYGGYEVGSAYGDLGIGANLRYRPVESLGLELSMSRYDQTFDELSERSQTVTQGSVELFAFPWSRVSPYVLAGITYDSRDINDCLPEVTVEQGDALYGPHAGVGLELALGDSLALDLEGRYTTYLNVSPDDLTVPAALQTTAGLVYHF